MENENAKHRTEDEFDIEALAEKLYRITKRAIRKLWSPVQLFGSRPLVSLIWVVAAIIIAFALSKTLTKVYETTFLFQPVDNGDLVFVNILNDIKTLHDNGDVEVLANELNVGKEELYTLQSFQFEIIWKTKAKDTANSAYLTIRSTDPSIFDKVQNGVMAKLENNMHYLNTRNDRNMENEYIIAKLGKELDQLDSLKRFLMEQTSPRHATGFVYGEPPEMVNVYHASIAYFTKQVKHLMEQKKDYSFELLKPVVTPTAPVFPKLTTLLALCLAVAFVGAVITNYRLINRPLD